MDPLIEARIRATWTDAVIPELGSLVHGLRIPAGTSEPIMILRTGGVGSKLDMALDAGRLEGIGHDLVSLLIDEIAAVGARPIAVTVQLSANASAATTVIASLADACREAGCAFLADDPNRPPADEARLTLTGTAFGTVTDDALITGDGVRPGDAVVGVLASGLGTTGYELLVGSNLVLESPVPGTNQTLGDLLLKPSQIATPAVMAAIEIGAVHGLANICGSGLEACLDRSLPDRTTVRLDASAWGAPVVFDELQSQLGLSDARMAESFNMGIDFALVVDAEYADPIVGVLAEYGRPSAIIGQVLGTG